MKKTIILTSATMVALTLGSSALVVPRALADTVVNNQTNINNNDNQPTSSEVASSMMNTNSVKDNDGHAVQTKALTKPYVVYGAGLSQSQQSSVGEVLGVQDNFETMTATANDYREFIDNSSSATTNAEMISSVALEPTDPGSGVKVNIKSYNGENNITSVTAQQYAMVATLAGVKDMNIIVTAPTQVSGTSALTGVYVALQNDGIKLDSQNTSVANNMLNATQEAVSQNNNDPKYSGQLSNAVMNTAQEVAKEKQADDKPLTAQQVQDILNKNLNKQGIKNKTPQNVVNNITNVITNNFQKAPVSDTKSFIDNADNTIDNIKENIKNGGKSMFNFDDFKKNLPSENKLVAWWHSVCNWFSGLFHRNNNDQTSNEENDSKQVNETKQHDNQNDEPQSKTSSMENSSSEE